MDISYSFCIKKSYHTGKTGMKKVYYLHVVALRIYVSSDLTHMKERWRERERERWRERERERETRAKRQTDGVKSPVGGPAADRLLDSHDKDNWRAQIEPLQPVRLSVNWTEIDRPCRLYSTAAGRMEKWEKERDRGNDR